MAKKYKYKNLQELAAAFSSGFPARVTDGADKNAYIVCVVAII